MHLEFIVPGVPVSNQATGPRGTANLNAWKAAVKAAAQKVWKKAPLTGNLKAIIINFHSDDEPSVDVDNMSKPILDVMQQVVYADDRQIRQAEITHVRIGAAMVFLGVSRIIVNAVQKGQQFVYVRVEDAVDPFPLPR
jgi:Holliday junction resolvase RusA-like endonuclease